MSRGSSPLHTLFRALALLLGAIFGRFDWSAPTWLHWIGARIADAFRFVTANRKRITITASTLLIATSAFAWYHFRPKPQYVAFTVTAPKITTYDDKGMPVIAPLAIEFAEPVAPLAALDKPVSSGVDISPKFAGKWNWLDDRHLQFTPAADWPVDAEFTVDMKRDGFFRSETHLDDYSFDFKTKPFDVSLSEHQFYQDPQNPALKKVVATAAFSHPVDPAQFEPAIALVLEKDAAFLGLTPDSARFTVVYDKLKLHAYIHSAPLAMPRDDASITVRLARGIHAARGGNSTGAAIEARIAIPGRTSLRFDDARMTLVDNAKYEPEQVLLIGSSSPVAERAFTGKVQAYVLPVRSPKQSKDDKNNYNWSSTADIGADILSKSQALTLTYLSSDDGQETTHGFKFNAPVGRWVYLLMKDNIEGIGGYISGKPYVATVQVIPYRQTLTFIGKGALLSLAGDKRVGFLVRDIDKVEVEVGRVLPNQLQHLGSRMYDFTKPQLYDLEDYLVERFTTVREYKDRPPGKPIYDNIDLGQYLANQTQNRRGLFLLHVRKSQDRLNPQFREPAEDEEGEGDGEGDEGGGDSNPYSPGLQDSRLILVTDLGIIVKKWNDGRRDVFVQSIRTGEPVGGAHVEMLGQNGQPVASITTDATGRAQLPKLTDLRREKTPFIVLAEKDADFSFLPLRSGGRDLDMSRFETGGLDNATSPTQLSSYLFTDRGIYRPGETAHIGMITRTADWKSSLTGLPVDVEITDPRGNTVLRNRVKLSETAFDEVTLNTQPASATGTYQAEAWLAKDEKRREILGSVSFNVQEFEPDRMKVRLDLSSKSSFGWLTPAEVKATVNVAHLFGEPASNRRIEGELNISPVLPRFSQYPNHRFQIGDVVKEPYQQTLPATITDDKGNATLNLDLERFTGRAYRLNVLARAFEAEGGRGVAANNSAIVADAPYLVGVKTDGDVAFIRRGTARRANWLAVDRDLKPVAATDLTLEWVERKYLSVLTQQDDRTFKYVSRLKETVRSSQPTRIAAGGSDIPLPTNEPGEFILILRNSNGAELNRLTYSVAGEANISRNLERNAELQIQLDKPGYAGGDTINVSIRAPYTGSGLITIERDRVFHHQWFHTNTTSSVQRVTLPRDFEGNGYVSVQFLRDPASDEIFMSPLSYGTAPFLADLNARTRPITITAPDTVRPGSPLTMHVTPNAPSRVAVFAIDEGILQVARYKNPDPLSYFFQKRRLEVQTSQILDLLLPEFRRFIALAAAGGDADGGFSRHLNPFNKKHKPPVAWWSGIVDVGPAGRDFRYNVPDYYNGRLRIVAVAVDPAHIGVAQADTEVKGDFILSPNVPSMVAPGDEFSVSVGVFNNTIAKDPIKIQIQTSRELSLVSAADATLDIAAKREGVAQFRFKANSALGAASLKFVATRGRTEAHIDESISVRPAVALRTQLTLGRFNANDNTVSLKRDMYPELRTVQASISALPTVWGEGLIAYLDEYPYPCTEQLVSKGFAALMLASRPEFGTTKTREAQPIAGTISMLQSRENESGGFGLWASSPETAEFPTIYAAHFLIEARDRGQKFPPEMLASVNEWLTRFATTPASTLEAGRMRAYAVYLLARQGIKPTVALANVEQELSKRYAQNWTTDLAAAYLAATYKLMQRNADADRILKAVPWAQQKKTWPDEFYYEAVVHDAQLLYVTAKHFPESAGNVPGTALEGIASAISGNRVSSLSAAYTLLGLDVYAKAAAPRVKLGIIVNGQAQPAQSKVAIPIGAQNVRFTREGTLPAYFSINESGFDRNPPAADVQNGLEVIHDFIDAKGTSLTKVKEGDEFYVRVRMRATNRNVVNQVAVVDILPGGIEPTLDRKAGPGANWSPQYVDYREDRVILYGDLTQAASTFVYKVRATNIGIFQAPPAFAEAMYNHQITGSSKASKLEIVKP